MAIQDTKNIKVAFIGGGSQIWTPYIVRDIIFKEGMERAQLDISLMDLSIERANSIKALFDSKLQEWGVNRVRISATTDSVEALTGADFVIIAISTGRLEAMRNDLEIPEKYGIYHTVGDTSGPGGWSRALRNIPVFVHYARQIRELCPNAVVLNYTNPMGVLTNVLARELGDRRVVGLCHGVFSTHDMLKLVFGVTDDKSIKLRFGGLNHFFWVTDFTVNGQEGYPLLAEKLAGRRLVDVVKEIEGEEDNFQSAINLMSELYSRYGYLTYAGDRHICEFLDCYLSSTEMMDRFKLVRTSVEDREGVYEKFAERIDRWTRGEDSDIGPLSKTPSRETAADIIKAISFDEGFVDAVNIVNRGQMPNLPYGAVVETLGYVDSDGITPLVYGGLPEVLRAISCPPADVQLQVVEAGMSGNMEAALAALELDPVCAHLSKCEIRKMGMELIEANEKYMVVPSLVYA